MDRHPAPDTKLGAGEVAVDLIRRPRLERCLVRAADSAITVLVGAAGSGKSETLHAQRGGSQTISFRVGNERRTFARFVRGLAEAVSSVAHSAHASFPRAWERSLQSRSPSIGLAHWLCEHLDGIDANIVIDDLHDAAADPSIASFLAKIAELRPDARLTIAVRSVGALPIALWSATRRMERPIQDGDLCFDVGEVVQAAEQRGLSLPSKTTRTLLAATNGLPVAVTYALMRLGYDADEFFVNPIPASFDCIAADIFARRSADEKEFLMNVALLPAIEDDVLRLCGWQDSQATRTSFGSDAAFMWNGHDQGRLEFCDRFRDFLTGQFQTREMGFRAMASRRMVDALTAAGRYVAALEVATREHMTETIGDLLDARGFALLESGEVEIISEALAAVEELSMGATGLALRGYIEARAGHLDTAESWFRLSLDKAQDEVSRVTVAMYYSRELTKRRRPDAYELLEAFATSTSLPPLMLIDVRSSFARALTVTDRLDEARIHVEEALALLDAESPPALRARVFERSAFVALASGQHEIARERALIAAPLAAAHSLYEVAASAYAHLYEIAYTIDDDPAAVRKYLGCQRDMALKCGILRADLFGMLGIYELDAEAGDEAALAKMEVRLTKLDKHDANAEIIEVMIPSKALQAGWAGQFDAAQRLLRPTAEHQATAVRRALCWAQIAVYCAASGDPDAADKAAKAAQNSLGQLKPRELLEMQYGFTLLTLALAALVGNDVELARARVDAADDSVIGHARRLCAMRATVRAMIEAFDDTTRFAQSVPRTLVALRAVSFGGIAKLIEALPYRCSDRAGIQAPIGKVLAHAELLQRFETAVESEESAPLKAWLDAAHHSTFEDSAIAARFEHWVAENSSFGSRTQAGIWNVRRELAAYRRPALAVVGLVVDEIDAALEILFEQLEVASPLMAEHSRAVSAWCSRLGRTIGLSESEITFVSRCGLIHDIGKIRTPAGILEAPRGLSPEEWVIMRAHTTDGSVMVERVPILRPFVPIVRGHHERLDGKGYPDGLPSNAIPLAARIVAVADCFNAMIGRRAYRPAMPPTEALNELERHRGTQFDPEIVEAMVQIVLGRVVEPPAAVRVVSNIRVLVR
jgi:putative nucleotidyltransferase with HDIG domain